MWISKDGYQMTAGGLNEIIRRIQKTLKIKPIYSLHDFRRYKEMKSVENPLALADGMKTAIFIFSLIFDILLKCSRTNLAN